MPAPLPGDNPQAYIPGDRRRALARGEDLPLQSSGAAMFVDISGFTSLTEALARELGGRRGAEELTATLQRVFAALLEPLHIWRGSVVYFSGDAVTAWIDGDDGSRATACGLAMQSIMQEVGVVSTPGGNSVTLGVKVAVAVGEVHRFVVGDPNVQLIDVLAGRLMDSLAAAEARSQAGEVVLDSGALASLEGRVTLIETREGDAGAVGIVDALVDPPTVPEAVEEWPALPLETARQWLLPPVWERLVAGRGEFLADLRPAVPIFVRFGGLDFEHDPQAPTVLGDFVTRAQLALDEMGGSVLQLTIGDKGAYLYAVFGAPLAHEDDATRACEGALKLLEIPQEVPVTDVQIGVATGRLRSGTYGHYERRTFCCLGDAVNLAARLMTRAPANGIWVHGDVAEQTGERFEWDDLPSITVKGRVQEVSVRALRGRSTRRRTGGRPAALNAMVGRDAELARLRELWQAADDGRGQVVVVQAEAGTGKSRLVDELVGELTAAGVHRRPRRGDADRRRGRVRRLARRVGRPARPRRRAHRRSRHRRGGAPRAHPRRPRAPARPRARAGDARQRPHGVVRRRAPQDLAGGPAPAAPRGQREGQRRRRRRGRALARPALARRARGAGARHEQHPRAAGAHHPPRRDALGGAARRPR